MKDINVFCGYFFCLLGLSSISFTNRKILPSVTVFATAKPHSNARAAGFLFVSSSNADATIAAK